MSRMRHASDFKIDELREYVARARASTVQRLLDEELASARPRPKAVDALEARLAALRGPVERDAAMAGAAPEPASGAAGSPASAPVTTVVQPEEEDVALAPEPEAEEVALVPESEVEEAPTGAEPQGAAQDLATQAREKGQEVTARAQDRVRDEVNQRSSQAGEQVGSIAGALRRLSGDLRAEGQDWAATLADQGAEKAEQLAAYLRDLDAERALKDLNQFARSKPQVVVAGGLALGFAASRLVKASRGSRAGGEGEELSAPEAVDLAQEAPVPAPAYPEPPAPQAAPGEDVLPEAPAAGLTPGERARALAYRETGQGSV